MACFEGFSLRVAWYASITPQKDGRNSGRTLNITSARYPCHAVLCFSARSINALARLLIWYVACLSVQCWPSKRISAGMVYKRITLPVCSQRWDDCRCVRQILTSDDDTLRIATVQCCLKLLNADSHFAETLLECDISGNHCCSEKLD